LSKKTKNMTSENIEKIFNKTFAGLSFFYRDLDLDENLLSKYSIGQILLEKGFIDMTHKANGIAGNTRYLIASANGKDISSLRPDDKDFGHILLSSDSYFKVLDILRIKDKTQIFLLEIPEETTDFFANNQSNVEDEIIEKARENFNVKHTEQPLPQHLDSEWTDRTSFPIGMNDKGELFFDNRQKSSLQLHKTASKPWWKIW
jgi:hypothetical protein